MSRTSDTSPVIAYDVTSAIRQELGKGFMLSQFITQDKIDSCAQLLHEASNDYFIEAAADLEQLKTMVTRLAKANDLRPLQTYIYNIKALAKVLGFSLITELCIHCLSIIDSDRIADKKKFMLLPRLVEALQFAFSNRIRDDGGASGQALLNNLRSYIPH